jgi:hypothetical protein
VHRPPSDDAAAARGEDGGGATAPPAFLGVGASSFGAASRYWVQEGAAAS